MALINNTGTWPRSFLIGPFYGQLNLDQMYSPKDHVLTVVGAPVFSMNQAASTSPSVVMRQMKAVVYAV